MTVELKPTVASIARVVNEYDELGKVAFLQKYEKGRDALRWLVRINGKLYPMKAIWVAAHEPPPDAAKKDYMDGILQLRDLGFFDIVAVGEEDRAPIRAPTRGSTLRAMIEIREIGTDAFLQKYGHDFEPDNKYLREAGFDYPVKALFAAAHEPPARPRHFENRHAVPQLKALRFKIVIIQGKPMRYKALPPGRGLEGSYVIRELRIIQRNRTIVEQAKALRTPLICEGCTFDFEDRYGEHGRGFIEAHHIEPLHKRAGVEKPTGIEDFAMLCANCHRMVHRGRDSLTLEELQALVRR